MKKAKTQNFLSNISPLTFIEQIKSKRKKMMMRLNTMHVKCRKFNLKRKKKPSLKIENAKLEGVWGYVAEILEGDPLRHPSKEQIKIPRVLEGARNSLKEEALKIHLLALVAKMDHNAIYFDIIVTYLR